MNVMTTNVQSVIMSSVSKSSIAFGLHGAALRPGCAHVDTHVAAPIVGLSESACIAGGFAAKLDGGHLGADVAAGDFGRQILAPAGLLPAVNDCHGVEQLAGSNGTQTCAPVAEAPLCVDNELREERDVNAEPLPLQSSWLFREDL